MSFELIPTKSLLHSKTVWSAVIAILAGLSAAFGHDIAPADQAELVNSISGLIAAGGGIGAIVGRVVARKRIG